jgi:hypothetical protein
MASLEALKLQRYPLIVAARGGGGAVPPTSKEPAFSQRQPWLASARHVMVTGGTLAFPQQSLWYSSEPTRPLGSNSHVTGSEFTAGSHVILACSPVAAVRYLGS